MDCEETFLKTDPTSPDTDGDFVNDMVEIRNQMNPLDPTDAFGDINKDDILNRTEIQDGLSPTQQVSSNERQFALISTLTPAVDTKDAAAAGRSCYNFDLQHLRLLTTPAQNPPGQPAVPEGVNYVYYDVIDSATDTPTTLATVRRACAKVFYRDGTQKLPLSGVVNFTDGNFVPLDTFSRSNCVDLTQSLGDGGSSRSSDGAAGGGG
jgi:hypothetical protein